MYEVKTFQGQPARFTIASKVSLTGYTFNLQTSESEDFTTPLFRGTAELSGNTVVVEFTAAEVNELTDAYFRIEAVKSGSPTFFLAHGRLEYVSTLAEVTSGMVDSDGYLIEPYVQGLLQNTRLATSDDVELVSASLSANYRKWHGSGTTYPAGAVDGDFMYRTDLGCLMMRTNGAWRQINESHLANATAVNALPTAALYNGFIAWQDDTNVQWKWNGTKWVRLTIEADNDWLTPTLLNNWVNFASPFGPSRYRKLPDGQVEIQGLVLSGVISTTIPIFTLPVGYRPGRDLIIATYASDSVAQMRISTGGAVVPYNSVATAAGGTPAWYSISCSFFADG